MRRVTKLQKQTHALKARISRFPKQRAQAVGKAIIINASKAIFSMKNSGIITNDVRALIRDLVANGVTPERVFPVLKLVTDACGVEIAGSISARTVSRVVIEGGIADDLQVVDAVQKAAGITYSGDGTTIRGIAHESRTVNIMDNDGERTRLSLGVHSAVNHTAETQLLGLQSQLHDIFATYNSSLEKGEAPMDPRTFAKKLSGANTDHAADQKKLARLLEIWKIGSDRELRGQESLLSRSPEELLPILMQATTRTVERAGGCALWDSLSESEKVESHNKSYHEICEELGEMEFQKLPTFERELASFFAWAGCCMHKELNTVKGGYSEVTKFWGKNDIDGPITLPNKDAAAAVAGGVEPAKSVQGGAVKATSLAGAVFNHKDDKKGEQDSLRCAFEAEFGFSLNFPDTSNTRYQSHCQAAAELLAHLDFYQDYFNIMKDRKEFRTLNHMEKNLQLALQDLPTISELCVLALFLLSISHPYMRTVRGEGFENLNVLDMGPTHKRVEAHMEKILANPMILLASDANFEEATLNGKPWIRPEVMYVIWKLKPTLPHLKGLTVAFFTGALETWRRFTAEYAPGGLIATASPRLRALAWMPTTNDINEGALGSRRVIKRSYPKAAELTLNAQQRYRWNKTGKFIKSLPESKLIFLRKRARYLQSLKIQKNLRIAQAEYDKSVVIRKHVQDAVKLDKRQKAAEILSKVQPIISLEVFGDSSLKNADLDLQLLWHRQFNSGLAKKTELKNKALKQGELKRAIEQLNLREDRDDILAQYVLSG
ncbi:hypothetical protein M422DRAFT_188816 [Sphaerobolus stellatus SS14]|uniref:Uncharacterized protein n=1 Tax=Sphaerobolus stellatus (strain SS14) TaxID=990650 RepID=A0A0C9UVH5_SPHS4|nr:hypothetical protein M422DRAFT_188816 [Sphaerobolus stellatus SS14]